MVKCTAWDIHIPVHKNYYALKTCCSSQKMKFDSTCMQRWSMNRKWVNWTVHCCQWSGLWGACSWQRWGSRLQHRNTPQGTTSRWMSSLWAWECSHRPPEPREEHSEECARSGSNYSSEVCTRTCVCRPQVWRREREREGDVTQTDTIINIIMIRW